MTRRWGDVTDDPRNLRRLGGLPLRRRRRSSSALTLLCLSILLAAALFSLTAYSGSFVQATNTAYAAEAATEKGDEHAKEGEHAAEAGGGHGAKLHFDIVKEGMRIINFVILLGVLVFALKKPFLNALSNRTATIERTLKEAQEARDQAEAKQREYETKLANLNQEIDAIRTEARREAQALSERIVTETQSTMHKLTEQTQRGIEAEKQRALEALRAEAATLSLQLAEELLANNLTQDDQQRLVDDYVQRVGDVW